MPLLFLPILLAWLLGLLWHKLAAMPFAVLAFVLVLVYVLHSGSSDFDTTHSLVTNLSLIHI